MNAREEAGRWLAMGVATIPVLYRDKAPALRSWKEYQTTLPSKRDLEMWFNGRKTNLAIITGWRGLVVVDFDDPMAFSKWLIGLPTDRALEAINTYQVKTARGRHLYFFAEGDMATHTGIRDSIDIKAQGGYVLGPPSVHPAGHSYSAHRTPHHILTIPDLTHLNLEPKRDNLQGPGREPPSLADIAMRENCIAAIDDLRGKFTTAGLLGLPAGYHKINCPLPNHHDEHASFVLYTDDHFHCYGCGAHGGDFLDLYRHLHDLNYAEAINELARMGGLI